ncbi:restriction endonuclease subunit S [Brevibacillus sp. SAFN-007a]|uniref:restriction endonuclease subunit S n=1 Tax=Brevibacillus sp. SAFN-007a TaxID=3436862 RepID=UPI003F8102B7
MSEWKTAPLGLAVRVQGGYPFSSAAFVDEGTPVVRMSNMKNGRLDLSQAKCLPETTLDKYRAFLLQPGDLLLGMSGSIENFAEVHEADLPALLNQRVGRLQVRDDLLVHREYLKFVVTSKGFRDRVLTMAAGVAQLNISAKQLESIPICYPSLWEQRKIAAILTSVDAVIEKTEAIVAQIQVIQKGLMHELFTKGIGHTAFVQTDQGTIPKGWSFVRLKEIAKVQGGKRVPKGSRLVDTVTPYPYIRVSDLGGYTVQQEQLKYATEEIYNKIKRYTISRYDLYLSIAGIYLGAAGRVPDALDGALLTENAAKITPTSDRIDLDYLMFALSSDFCQRQIAVLKGVTGVPKLGLKRVEAILIPLPPLEEQHKIVAGIKSILCKRTVEEAKLQQLRAMKKALMQLLLTGSMRVKSDEAAEENA